MQDSHRDQLYAALEAERSSAYVLSTDLSIQFVNEAWRQFARENGAPDLATSWRGAGPITHFITLPLRAFFRDGFAQVLESNQPWSHVYECSSPSVYRRFNMRVDPMHEREGFIVVHSCVVVAPALDDSDLDDSRNARTLEFTDARGLIVQCEACGRVRRDSEPPRWDWVIGLQRERITNLSHGICSTCELRCYPE